MEAFDDTTYETNRLMFWPTVSRDAVYFFKSAEGPWLDPDEVLATYADWHDMRTWPVSSRQQRAIRRRCISGKCKNRCLTFHRVERIR